MSSLREYDVNLRALYFAGSELSADRRQLCKTSPLVEARVLIASGEWWIKVSWALHSHRNCIKGSSVIFIFVRCRWSRDLRNTCEKGLEWHLRVERARLSCKWGQVFPSLRVRLFMHFFRWDVEVLTRFRRLCVWALVMRGRTGGSSWMHDWFSIEMTVFYRVVAASKARSSKQTEFIALIKQERFY